MKIFIGYLLVFFHIRLNGFDILPDFIGYLLIYLGATTLYFKSDSLAKSRPISIIMTVFSFLTVVGSIIGINYNSAVFVALNFVSVILVLYLTYLVVKGIQEIEKYDNIYLLGDKTEKVFKVQVFVNIISEILTIPVSLFQSEAVAIILSLFLIAVMVVNVILLVHIFNAKKLYDYEMEQKSR